MADRKKSNIERAKSADEDFVRGLLDLQKRKDTRRRAGPKLRVLSIDGGGMRGLIPARMIAYLEQALKEKSGNPDATVADYFDLVAGSSIGGVIAIMLFTVSPEDGKPLFNGQEAWRLIAQKGKDIFKLPYPQRLFSMVRGIVTPRYPSRFLEKMLEEYLGEMTLENTQKAVVIPCYNLKEASGFYFYNNLSRCANFKLTEVCRATTAAPTIFKPAKVTSVNGTQSFPAVDGGLVTNNPTLVAITHAVHDKQRFPKVEGVQDMLVLSLGTGQFDQHYTYEEVRRWGALQWAKPIAKAIMDGISDMVDHTVSMAFIGNRENYVRIQVSGIPDDVAMDDPSPANVNRLLKIADDLLEQKSMEHQVFGGRDTLEATNRERLDWFAEQLVLQQLLQQQQQQQQDQQQQQQQQQDQQQQQQQQQDQQQQML